MSSEQNDFLFLDQDYEDEEVAEQSKFWDILIVDDEPEIHSVTKLALSGFEYGGAGLRFHDAYSGAEAMEVLANNDSICLILLDVIMETDDAGLQIVKKYVKNLIINISESF